MSELRVRRRQDMLWLILDQPPLNLLTPVLLKQLAVSIHTALAHPPRLIVLTSTGEQAFCAGCDEAQRGALRQAALAVVAALDEARAKRAPPVALVKGLASGPGCELALLCETVIAREDATFQLPEPDARIFPTALSTALPAAVGQEEAARLLRQPRPLTAREAMHLGIVQQVLPARRFVQDTEELLTMLATLT